MKYDFIIKNIDKYKYFVEDGNLMIIKKENDMLKELLSNDYKKSKIIYFEYNNKCFYKFNPILIDLYKTIGNKEEIIKLSGSNIRNDKFIEKGFQYYPEIKLSIQGAGANKTFKEIIKALKFLNIIPTLH